MISPQLLQRYPYFLGAGYQLLEELAQICEIATYNSGDEIFGEDGRADALYLIHAGMVDLTLTLGDGRAVAVDTLVAGELLGLSALSDRRLWQLNAIAKKPCELIEVDADTLNMVCEREPMLGYRLLKGVIAALNQRLSKARVQLAAAGGE